MDVVTWTIARLEHTLRKLGHMWTYTQVKDDQWINWLWHHVAIPGELFLIESWVSVWPYFNNILMLIAQAHTYYLGTREWINCLYFLGHLIILWLKLLFCSLTGDNTKLAQVNCIVHLCHSFGETNLDLSWRCHPELIGTWEILLSFNFVCRPRKEMKH